MLLTWVSPNTDLGTIQEKSLTNISLVVSSSIVSLDLLTFKIIAGKLPSGLRLVESVTVNGHTYTGAIIGTPVEVTKLTTYRFVVRATLGTVVSDRTFTILVDGADDPYWLTNEGFLNVGPANSFFVLDNSYVDFHLSAADTDTSAGDVLTYRIISGEFPPGLTLSASGQITGFTTPIEALSYSSYTTGGYDTAPWDVIPLDFATATTSGYDTFLYDSQQYDYSDVSTAPKHLSRIYTFSAEVSDGIHASTRLFKMYVVSDEFLQADNNILEVSTNLFQADSAGNRKPIWVSNSNLGKIRANNYVTIFLDVFDPPSLNGTVSYFMLTHNPDGTLSKLPPGMTYDSVTGDIAGRVPYQDRITVRYTFTMIAVNFTTSILAASYKWKGNWTSSNVYQVNDVVQYLTEGVSLQYIATTVSLGKQPTNTDYWIPGVSSSNKTFYIDVIGEIDTAVVWITPPNLGTISPNINSVLHITAKSLLEGGSIKYKLGSGTMPPGLELFSNGLITGKVRQYYDSKNLLPGLTRFFDSTNSSINQDSTHSKVYNVTFDKDVTSFDTTYKFTVLASDTSNYVELPRTFSLSVIDKDAVIFANVYAKAFLSKDKRLYWNDFITDSSVFPSSSLYRYGDINYGLQSELKFLLFAGIESVAAVEYVQSMGHNHTNKQILFGDVKVAIARDPSTQDTIYEVVYVEIVDDLEKNGVSISEIVELPDTLNSKVLVSYDNIRIDSDIPLISDSDKQRVFPNSIKNMRKRMAKSKMHNNAYLPLWMKSIQPGQTKELGYVKALVLCYTLPGESLQVIANIKAKTRTASRGDWNNIAAYQIGDTVRYFSAYYTCVQLNTNASPSTSSQVWTQNFDFKNLNFTMDRYLIDSIDGQAIDKYLAFPHSGEK